MKKQKLYFWELKDKTNFPIVVFSTCNLEEWAVIELARVYRLIETDWKDCQVSVRALDLNEIKMRDQNGCAYSLAPRAHTFKTLIKIAE